LIAQRLLILQLVAIYTTTYALTNCLLNLYSSQSKDEFVDGLRSEYSRVSAKHDGLSSKEAIDELYRTDSTIRESMRISPFSVLAPLRIVSPVKDLDIGNNITLPANTRVGVPFQAVHHDDGYYADALRFDAFRFSRKFEGPGTDKGNQSERELTVNISESFLAFGYGKHVCPGRWYTSQTLKQTLAHIVQNYDVEVFGQAEKSRSLLNTVLPPLNAQMRIRQRTGDGHYSS
jgi:cytochrome P450